ncbi:DUF5977 domain-containing protein [Chryseobacterium sp. c4a]|uniref:DUF5977 domain-containing protein n=1 Tax=Chryseobacterium sp. c4a TaxID=1573582 RepID=UPI0013570F0A|nr:DUF5977 domain-containing protein [Chryseobacterium sp. c4a]
MKKIIALAAILPAIMMWGQTLELPKNIQSPNAASLGKYGDIPMNLSTGRADINVPVYSLNDGNIPLDINLNYDTGGVRVNDHPGWVGQNWSLNAGGVITRNMKGRQFDEFENESADKYVYQGYLFNRSLLNVPYWKDDSYLRNIANNSVNNGDPDLEPDIFTFNFLGMSGKFFLGEDGEWKVASDSNLKVEIDLADNIKPLGLDYVGYPYAAPSRAQVKSIGKIKLTDGAGNQYFFGGNMNSIEFNVVDFFNQSNNIMFSSAWYLTKVLDKYNNEVYTLEYERGGYQASFYNSYSIADYRVPGGGGLSPGCNATTYLGQMYAAGSLIVPSYLKKIKALQSDLTFDFSSSESNSLHYLASEPTLQTTYEQQLQPTAYNRDKVLSKLFYIFYEMDGVTPDYPAEGFNNGFNLNVILKKLKWRKLDNISIAGKGFSKQIRFNYDDSPTTRLMLQRVDLNDKESYKFSYIKENVLPKYLSTQVDHFGYYNAKDFSLDPNIHYRMRQTNASAVQYGALNRIIYPTKGSTFFEYEPHRYAQALSTGFQIVPENGYIGGLRIKRKKDYDINFKEMKSVDYQYTTGVNAGLSSGILARKNLYSFSDWRVKSTSGQMYTGKTFSINSIIPLSNFSGSFIEYSSVIEKETGKGYTINQFTSSLDYPNTKGATLAEEYSIMDPQNEMGYKRGKLQLRSYYNENNALLKEEKYTYSFNQAQKAKAFKYGVQAACQTGNIITGNAYEVHYSDFTLKEKITKTYEGAQVLESKESYTYDPKDNFGDQFLRRKWITYPDNRKEEELYTYTFDKTTPLYNELSGKREYSIISKENKLDAIPIITSEIEYAKVPVFNNKGIATNTQNIFPTMYNKSTNGSPVENELTIDKYDKYGNILMGHTKGGTYHYYYYGYNGKYPILKIEGGVISNTALDSKIENLISLCENNATINSSIINAQKEIRMLLPEHQVTAYTYLPNIGVETISPSTGVTEYYSYDNLYRLQNIKDSNQKIIKEFTYNYSSIDPVKDIYYSNEKKRNVTKNDCPNGAEGGDYEYIVPFGRYVSFTSQQEADSKAHQDMMTQGQAEANLYESCEVTQCIEFSNFWNGLSIEKIGYRKVKVNIDLYFNNLSYYDWKKGVKIADIQLSCSPIYKMFRYDIGVDNPNAIWTVYVDTMGQVFVKYTSNEQLIPHYQLSFIFYAE